MHVHSHSQGASSVQNYVAGTTKNANAQTATPATSGSFDPSGATSRTASQTSTASTSSGATSSNPFASLSTNIQALLLGVGQGAQNAAGTATSTASQALDAYGATASFLSPASL